MRRCDIGPVGADGNPGEAFEAKAFRTVRFVPETDIMGTTGIP